MLRNASCNCIRTASQILSEFNPALSLGEQLITFTSFGPLTFGRVQSQMKVSRLAPRYPARSRHQSAQSGSVRTAFLVIVAFILGLGISALWLRSSAKAPSSEQPGIQLSASTKSILTHLNTPVKVRFYSLLDPSSPA